LGIAAVVFKKGGNRNKIARCRFMFLVFIENKKVRPENLDPTFSVFLEY
jgi:hypothetical protein